jgi:hypothetical protein
MTKESKTSRQAQLQAILNGIAKRFPNVTTLTFGGVTWNVQDFVALIQKDIDDVKAIAPAKASYALVVQMERNTRAKLTTPLRSFKNFVIGTFGDTQDAVAVLADFGLTPRKSRKATSKVKAGAADKSKATREARGTMSKKAKAKIKGTVPATAPASGGSPAPKA